MKNTMKYLKPLMAIFAILLTITVLTTKVLAAEPNDPTLWTVEDEPCTSVTVVNGVATYTNGFIRHCYAPDKEQCVSHICQSTNPNT